MHARVPHAHMHMHMHSMSHVMAPLQAEPELALAAAGAVANVLQHASLAPLWTDAPRRQSYLLAVGEAERERLLRRPAELAKPTSG
jgi:hypothetical protein